MSKLAVKGIIRRKDGKILIVKRSHHDDHRPGAWETVGGGAEENCVPQRELEREIMEEAGIEVEVGEPFNVFTFKKDTGERKVGITFLCNYSSGEVVLSHEHRDFAWIDPADFKNYESVPSLHDEIKKYIEKFPNL